MKRSIRHAALIATTAAVVIGAPTAAFAGTRAQTSCTESFARWHTDLEQPEGGYVTIDFGRDGVDYTTYIWQSLSMVGVGGPYKGTTIRVIWHAADGTKLGEKGNGVSVEVDSCSPTTDVIPSEAPPTTLESSATEVPVATTEPAPVTTEAAPAVTEAAPTVTEPAVTEPAVTEQAVVPPTVAIVHADLPATTVVAPAAVPATVAAVLPATGAPQRAAVLAGMITLLSGFVLVGTSRRRTAPVVSDRPSKH